MSRGSRQTLMISPTFTPAATKNASSAATRMSQASASSSPPPTAPPVTAATTGTRSSSIRSVSRRTPSRKSAEVPSSRARRSSPRCPPALKWPTPVRTSARTAVSASTASSARPTAARTGAESALAGGWSRVRTATYGPSRVSRTPGGSTGYSVGAVGWRLMGTFRATAPRPARDRRAGRGAGNRRSAGGGTAPGQAGPGTSRRAAPSYAASGRISEFAASCSEMWAVHPVIRDITNSGVNIGMSNPIRW